MAVIDLEQELSQAVADSIQAVSQLQTEAGLSFMREASLMIADSLRRGGKVIVAGNGGSLCDAMHFAEELTGFFRAKRRALPAIALSCPGHITCTGNDVGFEYIFSRGVEAYGKPGDVFVGLTTSGNSPNIIHAIQKAEEIGLHTIAFLGKDGGKCKGRANLEIIIDGLTSDRIQEAHMAAIHMIIQCVETQLTEILYIKDPIC